MSPTLERLKPEIDRLSFEEREELANYLCALAEPSEQSEETIRGAREAAIERRIEKCNAGEDDGIPVEELMEAMRRKYNL